MRFEWIPAPRRQFPTRRDAGEERRGDLGQCAEQPAWRSHWEGKGRAQLGARIPAAPSSEAPGATWPGLPADRPARTRGCSRAEPPRSGAGGGGPAVAAPGAGGPGESGPSAIRASVRQGPRGTEGARDPRRGGPGEPRPATGRGQGRAVRLEESGGNGLERSAARSGCRPRAWAPPRRPRPRPPADRAQDRPRQVASQRERWT